VESSVSRVSALPLLVAAEGHVGDVDLVFAEDGAVGGDHAGAVDVLDEEQRAFGRASMRRPLTFTMRGSPAKKVPAMLAVTGVIAWRRLR
jgi:hypothetical protein